jgi:hypothetical protein
VIAEHRNLHDTAGQYSVVVITRPAPSFRSREGDPIHSARRERQIGRSTIGGRFASTVSTTPPLGKVAVGERRAARIIATPPRDCLRLLAIATASATAVSSAKPAAANRGTRAAPAT